MVTCLVCTVCALCAIDAPLLTLLATWHVQNDQELGITKGEDLWIEVAKPNKEWWKVSNHAGEIGYVPRNYVQLMAEAPPQPPVQPRPRHVVFAVLLFLRAPRWRRHTTMGVTECIVQAVARSCPRAPVGAPAVLRVTPRDDGLAMRTAGFPRCLALRPLPSIVIRVLIFSPIVCCAVGVCVCLPWL